MCKLNHIAPQLLLLVVVALNEVYAYRPVQQAFRHKCAGFGELRIPSRHNFWHPIYKYTANRLCSQQSMELPVSSLASEVCVNLFIERIRKSIRQDSNIAPLVFYSNSTDDRVTGNVICYVPNSLASNKGSCNPSTCQNGGTCTQFNDGQINCKCTSYFRGYTCQYEINSISVSNVDPGTDPRPIDCSNNVFQVIKQSRSSSEEYTWNEANSECRANGTFVLRKVDGKDFICLQQRMRQLTITLATHIHVWTSSCSGSGSNKKCGLFFFNRYHLDGTGDGYRPDVAISNKALHRVVACVKDINCSNNVFQVVKQSRSRREEYTWYEANAECVSNGLDLLNKVTGQDFTCLQQRMRQLTITLATDIHVWTSSCSGSGNNKKCGLFYFNRYHPDGTKDGYRPDVSISNRALNRVVTCVKASNCSNNVFQVVKQSRSSDEQYTWEKANAECQSKGMVVLHKVDGKDFNCLQKRMRQLTITLATHIHVWTSSCSGSGSNKKCGLFYFNQYHLDGSEDGYRPDIAISNKANHRVVACFKVESDITCNIGVFRVVKQSQSIRKEYTWNEANAECLAKGMVLPPKVEGTDFTCLQQRIRPLTVTLATHIHVWTSKCSGHVSNEKCGLYVFDRDHPDGINDGYRPDVDYSDKSFHRVVTCFKDDVIPQFRCDIGVYKFVKHSLSSSEEYNWDEASAECLARGFALPTKVDDKDFSCLQMRMRPLTTILATHIHVWTSTGSGHGSNKKCGLFFFDRYHLDGKRDGYRPDVKTSNKALHRVILCSQGWNILNCPGKNLAVFESEGNLFNHAHAQEVCKTHNMNLATGIIRQDPNFACIQDAMRSYVTQRNTHLHVWTRDCQSDERCSLWFFDKYRLDGLNDGYRPNVDNRSTTLSKYALCEKKTIDDCGNEKDGGVCHNGGTCRSAYGFFEKCDCTWGWTGLTCNETSKFKREKVSTRSQVIIFRAGGGALYSWENHRRVCIKSQGVQLREHVASVNDLKNVTEGQFDVIFDAHWRWYVSLHKSCSGRPGWSASTGYIRMYDKCNSGDGLKPIPYYPVCSRRLDYSGAVHILQLALDTKTEHGKVKRICSKFGGRLPDNELITFEQVEIFLPQLRLVNYIQGVREIDFFTDKYMRLGGGENRKVHHSGWKLAVNGSRVVTISSTMDYDKNSKMSPVCHSTITSVERTTCNDRFLLRPVPHQYVLTFKQALLVCTKLFADLPHYVETTENCRPPFGKRQFFARYQQPTFHRLVPVICQQPMHVCHGYGRLFVPQHYYFSSKLRYQQAKTRCTITGARLPQYNEHAARCVMEFMQRLQLLFQFDVAPETWWLLSNHNADSIAQEKHVICYLRGQNGHFNYEINWDSWDTTGYNASRQYGLLKKPY